MEAVIAASLPVFLYVDHFLPECILSFYLSGLVSESQGKVAKNREAECERQEKILSISPVSPYRDRQFWVRD